jgi:hypothetical protein
MPDLLRAVGAVDASHTDDVLYLGTGTIAGGARFVPVPAAELVSRWLKRAESQRDECLARFDLALVAGKEPTPAAREILAGFLAWTRWSAREFTKGAAPDALAAMLRTQEVRLWDQLADTAAAGASREAATVDRFLQVWLGVLHEAIRTGNAPLYAAT